MIWNWGDIKTWKEQFKNWEKKKKKLLQGKGKKEREKKSISHQSKLWCIRSISMGQHVFTTSQCAVPLSLDLLLCVIITPCWIPCKFQVQAILISSGSISLYKTTTQGDTIFPSLSGPLFLAAFLSALRDWSCIWCGAVSVIALWEPIPGSL